MIDFPQPTFIRFAAQVDGQLPFHQGSEVVAGDLIQVQTHHLEELFRSGANLLENFKHLGYIDFQLHGVSPFGSGFGTTHFKGDTPFFSSLEIHTIGFTLPFFCLVAQPFQAVRKSLAQVENLCHQKLVESTTSPLVGNDEHQGRGS